MHQLRLNILKSEVLSIPLNPQPWLDFRGDWAWNYLPDCTHIWAVATDPSSSITYRKYCPFQEGEEYFEGRVIEAIQIQRNESLNWVWKVYLRQLATTDLKAYWKSIRRKRIT